MQLMEKMVETARFRAIVCSEFPKEKFVFLGFKAWTRDEGQRIDVKLKGKIWYYLGESGCIGEGDTLSDAYGDYIWQSYSDIILPYAD